QIRFFVHNGRDVSCLRRPAVRACFALGKNPRLIHFRQSDVAVAAAMDMHEDRPSDKKRILVDSCILSLLHTGQFENPLSQLRTNFRGVGRLALPRIAAAAVASGRTRQASCSSTSTRMWSGFNRPSNTRGVAVTPAGA